MTQDKIKSLQTKLKLHHTHLQKKYPMTKVVMEAIEALLEMRASDDLIAPWYSSIRSFIYDIEKEIEQIEGKQYSK